MAPRLSPHASSSKNKLPSSTTIQTPAHDTMPPQDDSPSPDDDREHVPRPSNSWILYRSTKLKECAAQFTTKQEQAEYSRMIASMWKTEPPSVKQYYKDLSDKVKLEHQRANPGYKYKPMKAEEKEALRQKKREQREEATRQRKEARVGAKMAKSKSSKVIANQQASGDDQSASPSSDHSSNNASSHSAPNNPSKRRVASPLHYQPYPLPSATQYPASAYGHLRTGSSRLTPPPSSADATPQVPTRPLPPHSQNLSLEQPPSVPFVAPSSLYPPPPLLGSHVQIVAQDAPYYPPSPDVASQWSRPTINPSRTLPLSPPEEPSPMSHLPPNYLQLPESDYNLWPSIENAPDWSKTTAQSDASSPLEQRLPWYGGSSAVQSRSVSLHSHTGPAEITLSIPQSSLSLPPCQTLNSASGTEQLNTLSLSELAPVGVSPSDTLTPPVEAGHAPLTITFPAGYTVASTQIDGLGNSGQFWGNFAASNIGSTDLSPLDNGEGPSYDDIPLGQFQFLTGSGGPALLSAVPGAGGSMGYDLEALDFSMFTDGNAYTYNGDYQAGDAAGYTNISMHTPMIDHGAADESDGDAGNISFGSIVSIPGSTEDGGDDARSRVPSSRSLRIVSDAHSYESHDEPAKMPYAPPAGAAKFATRRVAGNWRPTAPLLPNVSLNFAPPTTMDESHDWHDQGAYHHGEYVEQSPLGDYSHHGEQQAYTYHQQPSDISNMPYGQLQASNGPPPVPPRPSKLTTAPSSRSTTASSHLIRQVT